MTNDEFCYLCNENPKDFVVKLNGTERGICSHCRSLLAPNRPEVPDIDKGKRFA
jgi:hypothetical protein